VHCYFVSTGADLSRSDKDRCWNFEDSNPQSTGPSNENGALSGTESPEKDACKGIPGKGPVASLR